MKPRLLPKYIIILQRGRKKRYFYPINEAAMNDLFDCYVEKHGWKPFKMFRADYQPVLCK